MKIYSVTPLNFKQKITLRLPLKTGETAKITVNDDGYNFIKSIGYEIWNKGKIDETRFFSASNYLKENSLSKIVEDLDNRAKEGYDFFTEFTSACLKK